MKNRVSVTLGAAAGIVRGKFKIVLYGLGLAAFGILVFAVLLWALGPWLPYWVTYFVSAFVVYSVNYVTYADRVFGVRPTRLGYGNYLAASSVNVVVTSILLVFLVEYAQLGPVLARITVAIILTPLAYLFHTRHTFQAPESRRGPSGRGDDAT